MRHLRLAAWALAALALAGCADDRLEQPAGPDAPPPDLSYIGFRLTIDVATGQVTLARPASASTSGGPSRSPWPPRPTAAARSAPGRPPRAAIW